MKQPLHRRAASQPLALARRHAPVPAAVRNMASALRQSHSYSYHDIYGTGGGLPDDQFTEYDLLPNLQINADVVRQRRVAQSRGPFGLRAGEPMAPVDGPAPSGLQPAQVGITGLPPAPVADGGSTEVAPAAGVPPQF